MKAKDLRNSILQLAVEGRLVPQDATEEPASELMARIRDERRRLVAAGKAKAPKGGESVICRGEDGSWYERRGKGEPRCIDKEIPFDIPESWEWARLGSITSIATGKRDANFATGNGRYAFFTCARKPLKCDSYSFEGESIVMAGNGDISNISLYDGQFEAYQRTYVIQDKTNVLYMRYLFEVIHVFFPLVNLHQMFGSAIPYIRLGNLTQFLIPFPPSIEQRRIVAKVDELMPLVEEYGRLEEERERLDYELSGRLRKSVLQLAVEGRLVPQDAAGEPASELVARIRDERRRLVAAGRAKAPKGGESVIYRGEDGSWYERRGKGEPRCIDGEVPFDIPESWEWARLSTIAAILNGDRGKNYPAKSKLINSGIPFVSALNISHRLVVEDQMLYMTESQFDALRAGKLEMNDIVFCIRGSLGKFGVFPFEKGAIASSLVIVRPLLKDMDLLSFLNLLLDSPVTTSLIMKYNNGTAQPNMSARNFESFLLPIPPLAEQRRIVAKVDELMPLVGDGMGRETKNEGRRTNE